MNDNRDRPLILVVDDIEEDRMYLRTILEQAGYVVLTAETAEEGLTKARQQHPLLIVMDVKLPGISGFEATRRLKSDPLTARIPIVIVTALPAHQRRKSEAQHDALLEKPVSAEDLTGTISRLLDRL